MSDGGFRGGTLRSVRGRHPERRIFPLERSDAIRRPTVFPDVSDSISSGSRETGRILEETRINLVRIFFRQGCHHPPGLIFSLRIPANLPNSRRR